MIEIQRYTPDAQKIWNSLVGRSRNGNFLHNRNYMDYHADRFSDHSLIINRLGKPIAIFPANWVGNQINSHGGLTYGGLIYTEELGAEATLLAFEAIQKYFKSCGVAKIIYKPVPYIFHRYPCQEDLYALFRFDAKLVRRDASSVIALDEDFKFSKGRKWSINKAKKAGVIIQKTTDIGRFYNLLTDVLKKFHVTPTHTLAELTLLISRFPENISLYEASRDGVGLAGALIYDFGNTVHTQYLATSETGREIGALDFLLADLIENVYATRKYFSFGISTEQQGQILNTGLIAQKEGFGARAVVHDFYEWTL